MCFSTYAVPVILGEIKKLFRDGGTVKVSRSLKELGLKVNAERERCLKRTGQEPGVAELAEIAADDPGADRAGHPRLAACTVPDARGLTRTATAGVGRAGGVAGGSTLADRIGLARGDGQAGTAGDRELIRLRFFGGPHPERDRHASSAATQVQISRRERPYPGMDAGEQLLRGPMIPRRSSTG